MAVDIMQRFEELGGKNLAWLTGVYKPTAAERDHLRDLVVSHDILSRHANENILTSH